VERIKDYIRQSEPAEGTSPRIPGERFGAIRAANDRDGIRIDARIWEKILNL
jgi:LDH2 family malate/lactate/ureidoglycolate dehydrogenase